jgi:purine-binding chemotaxis protein CheW
MKIGLFSRLPGAGQHDAERKLVEFVIGEVRYGADIMRVREIINPRQTIPVPAAPSYLVGVADHRSQVVPVVDLRARFGLEPSPQLRNKWVIVDAGGTDTALLVDRVAGVTAVNQADRRDAQPLTGVVGSDWVRDVYGAGEGLVFELDLEATVGAVTEMDAVADPGGEP